MLNIRIGLVMDNLVEYKIAEKVSQKGGKTYYVGGFVRDSLLGIDNKDVDIEVHGISPETLYNILLEVGEPLSYGKSFGIYSLKGMNIDIAMPRIEKNTGRGHKDFEVYVDPYIDLTTAIKRRDFTINAIYKDVLSGEIIDPFNGIKDLENKTIRHIDDVSFVEDSLRVFRAAMFASRFNFDIAKETIDLCKTIDTKTLSKQRVEEELKKALLKSDKPSLFFKYLKQMNQLDYWFSGINTELIDKAIIYKNNINHLYEYLLSSLCIYSEYDIKTIVDENNIVDYVNNMKNNIDVDINNDYEINKLFFSLRNINDYIYLKMCINDSYNYLLDKVKPYEELIKHPYVMGKDLVENGLEPGEYFTIALNYANDLILSGINKEEALHKTIQYIKKITNN